MAASVERALLAEAKSNERTLAYVRAGLLTVLAALGLLAWASPGLLGFDGYPFWPAGVALLWLALASALLVTLRGGWYRPWLRRAVPLLDAAIVASSAGLFLIGDGATRPPTGGLGVIAAACALLAFTGALRLSRTSAQLSTVSAVVSWALVAAAADLRLLSILMVAGTILATGLLGKRVTRIIRRVITTEVARARLTGLYQKARDEIDAREEVLKIVSHDLRNPLGTVAMATDFLLDIEATPEVRNRQLAIIKRAGERMNRLIQDLLDVARIEAGRLPIEPRAAAVPELFGAVAEMMRPLAADKGLELAVTAPDDLPRVWIDPERIIQVFSNLIGNAIKFTPEGGKVTLMAERRGEKVWMCVRDTGPGIPPEQIGEIFGRMWQARKTDTRGIGLGLTIAKAIVEAHGEEIGVESRVGEGTEFWFTTPRADEKAFPHWP